MDQTSEPSEMAPRDTRALRFAGAVALLLAIGAPAVSQTTTDPSPGSPPVVTDQLPQDLPSTPDAANDPVADGAAPQPIGETSALPASTLPRDLSPWGMFVAADHVVKAVMIGLAFASLVTWTIWVAKSLEILAAGARLRRSLPVVLAADDLAHAERALSGRSGPVPLMVRAARHETLTAPAQLYDGDGGGFLPRVSSHLSRIEAQAARRLNVGIGFLATIGATAPFVGLFGTVWGIMNSFIGISESQTTNLAVVAPGIAEALLATALGLVAAIPAVVIYNVFARWIAAYRARLADASAAVERLVSRDLDHRRLVPRAVAKAAE